ncbi:uncharacterized protein LOC118756811 [Rhagoletis pomonella]|uniref:uncharacterized protein LOC118756810 n=1 Tax=Rhagoletis pomonella TaxID=28610 RepID=UPI001787046B|nr:uncharacterized protein LOC118756810 [Rhagoletis pomonella]XP_036347444.1 uncharacterized protein LOC118756811 [Rhagoletis pomonella]
MYVRKRPVPVVAVNEDAPPAAQPFLMNFAQPAEPEPSPLQQLAAIAAILAAQKRRENDYRDSNSDVDDDTEFFNSVGLPFRMRIAATPSSIGGEQMVNAADKTWDEFWRNVCRSNQ